MTTVEFASWIKAEMHRVYGDRVLKVILTGSRARGDYEADSDWDVVVVLRDGPSITNTGPLIIRKLTAPDGNKVEVVTTNEEGLNHPGKYMAERRTWGKEL